MRIYTIMAVKSRPLPVTNGLPLRLEHPFNTCNHLIMADAFSVVQLSQALLNFRSEPFVMVEVGFHYFLDSCRLLDHAPMQRV